MRHYGRVWKVQSNDPGPLDRNNLKALIDCEIHVLVGLVCIFNSIFIIWLFLFPENKALKVQTSGEADEAGRVDLEELIQCATGGKMELCLRAELSEQVEGNCEIVNELVAASTKGQMKKKRLGELGITQADDNLISGEMFVSIVGNQFVEWEREFGTFLLTTVM